MILPVIIPSFDKHFPVTKYVILKLEKLFPSNSFQYFVTYTNINPRDHLNNLDEHKLQVVKVHDDTMINCVRTLLQQVKQEWVFWCMNDKYLKNVIDLSSLQKIHDCILHNIVNDYADNILIARNNFVDTKLLLDSQAPNTHLQLDTIKLLRKIDLHNFYQPQFIKTSMMKDIFFTMFDRYVDSTIVSTQRDKFLKHLGFLTLDQHILSKSFVDTYKIFVPERSYVLLGESISNGKLTSNFITDLDEDKKTQNGSFDDIDISSLERTSFSWILHNIK